MEQRDLLEQCYLEYTQNLGNWIPEGLVEVDLSLLQRLELLHYSSTDDHESSLTHYFQVIESDEKITLFDAVFVVWIVAEPGSCGGTYTLIALQTPHGPRLEMGFVARGAYNTSKLVLRVLERFLKEIDETQEVIAQLEAT